MIIFNLSPEMGTAGPGTHGVWTRVDLWACGSLGLVHFLPDTRTSSCIAHAEVWSDPGCGRRRGLPRMLSAAQRLPALRQVWVCGIFSECLNTPDAQGLSAKITCPAAGDPPTPVPVGGRPGRGGGSRGAGTASQPRQALGVHTSPLSYPLLVALLAGEGET